jgi:hypothetical protein
MTTRRLVRIQDKILKHWCPGCECFHSLHVNPPGEVGNLWDWNQDMERPTIRPSFAHKDMATGKSTVCHYMITDGSIQYLIDCKHHLAGQTVPLPHITDEDMEHLYDKVVPRFGV